MGRQLDAGEAREPFPQGIIYRHTLHPRQLPGQRLLNDFGSGASGPTSESIAQQLFSLRCEGNFHESSIAQAGMEGTRIPWNRGWGADPTVPVFLKVRLGVVAHGSRNRTFWFSSPAGFRGRPPLAGRQASPRKGFEPLDKLRRAQRAVRRGYIATAGAEPPFRLCGSFRAIASRRELLLVVVYLTAKLLNCAVFHAVPIPAIPFVWLVSVTFATGTPSMVTWMEDPLKASAR